MNYKKINEDFYKQNFWELDCSKNKWFSKYVKARIFQRFIKSSERGVLLDAGGGTGNWARYFLKDFKKIIVSDISKRALDRIPEKNIVKIHCNILKTKLPKNSVDCILLADVFEHIREEDLDLMIQDLKRILKSTGKIIIFSNLYGFGWGLLFQRIFNKKKRLTKKDPLEGHLNRLTFLEYKSLAERNGLKIKNYYYYSIIFQQLTDGIKDNLSVVLSRLLHKEGKGKERKGTSIKRSFIEKEENGVFKKVLKMFSLVSYLDIVLFGKIVPGNSIFLLLEKDNIKEP